MTSMAWNPGTPQSVKDQWQDPMTKGFKGWFNRPGIGGLPTDPGIIDSRPTGGVPGIIDSRPNTPQGGWPQRPPQQQPTQQPTQNPWMGIMGLGNMANILGISGKMTGFGEQMGGFGEQMGGFGETLGGYQDLLGGYGEQLGGFGEQLGGFKDEFSGINDKLQGLEQGIASLTDKFGTQQQQQSPYRQNFGMNPFGSINPYTPFFGGLGMFMRRY